MFKGMGFKIRYVLDIQSCQLEAMRPHTNYLHSLNPSFLIINGVKMLTPGLL